MTGRYDHGHQSRDHQSRDHISRDLAFASARVVCRPIDADDRALYRALYTAPAVMDQIGPVRTLAEADALLAHALAHTQDPAERARYWRIAEPSSELAVGIVALVRSDRTPEEGELGVMLLPAAQGRGLGRSAVAGVIDGVAAGRWRRPFEALVYRHARANDAAGRIPAALGFACADDSASALVSWRLSRSDWTQQRRRWPTI
jgi:RimJ/RimL family protein N-acetyltransferase